MWLIAVATMTVGNIIAISQTNIKRMLAYSSIAHAGYILVAFVAGNKSGTSGNPLLPHGLCLYEPGGLHLRDPPRQEGGGEHPDHRLCRNRVSSIPLLAASMTIFLLSMAGIPPLGGFMAKFYVFSAAVKVEILLAGHPRSSQQRHLRLLLSPGDGADVFQGIRAGDHRPSIFTGAR